MRWFKRLDLESIYVFEFSISHPLEEGFVLEKSLISFICGLDLNQYINLSTKVEKSCNSILYEQVVVISWSHQLKCLLQQTKLNSYWILCRYILACHLSSYVSGKPFCMPFEGKTIFCKCESIWWWFGITNI